MSKTIIVHANSTNVQADFIANISRVLADKNPEMKIGVIDLNWYGWQILPAFGLTEADNKNIMSVLNTGTKDRQYRAVTLTDWQTDWRYNNVFVLGMPQYSGRVNMQPHLYQRPSVHNFIARAKQLVDVLFITTVPPLQFGEKLLKQGDQIVMLEDGGSEYIRRNFANYQWLSNNKHLNSKVAFAEIKQADRFSLVDAVDDTDEDYLQSYGMQNVIGREPLFSLPKIPSDLQEYLAVEGLTLDLIDDSRAVKPSQAYQNACVALKLTSEKRGTTSD